MNERPLASCCFAEFVGTWLLVFLGCGAVHSAVLTGAPAGVGQVALVWGVAIMAAAFVCGGVSGAHINPAITVALAGWGLFSWRRVVPYVLSQVAGAFVAAVALFYMFQPFIQFKEDVLGVSRGESGSIVTAMCYGEYYPNPGVVSSLEDSDPSTPRKPDASERLIGDGSARNSFSAGPVTTVVAALAEILGTMVLALVVAGVSDGKNPTATGKFGPVLIGLTVAALIIVIAPITQACFNPARDIGPRMFAYLAGWKDIAFPGPPGQEVYKVYVLAPIGGALLGVGLYRKLLHRVFAS